MNCIDCAPAPQAHFLSLQKADSERLIRLQIFAVFYINLYFDKGFAFETIAEPIFRPRQQQLSFIIDIAYFVQIGILRAGQLQRSWVTPKPRRQCRQSLYQNYKRRYYISGGLGRSPNRFPRRGKTDTARVRRAEPG